MSKKTTSNDARAAAILNDSRSLLPNGLCPICKGSWRGRDACSHGWSDVEKDNVQFLKYYFKS